MQALLLRALCIKASLQDQQVLRLQRTHTRHLQRCAGDPQEDGAGQEATRTTHHCCKFSCVSRTDVKFPGAAPVCHNMKFSAPGKVSSAAHHVAQPCPFI